MDHQKKSFEDLMREVFGPAIEGGANEPVYEERFPLFDNVDIDTVMHRNAHFGGSFSLMIEYYEKGGKGTQPAFSLQRLKQLQTLEEHAGKDLAAMLLTKADLEKLQETQKTYERLRKAYANKQKTRGEMYARLLSDLILSEDEIEKRIQAIATEGHAIVPRLLQVIQAPEFYDPLWPGYGLAPERAAKCLGEIGDQEAVVTLFEAIEEYDFFGEDTVLDALRNIGEPAKQFLLQILTTLPPTKDTERAARALIYFSPDEELARACLSLLQIDTILSKEILATYLVLNCSGLKSEEEREQFLQLKEHKEISHTLKQDIASVASEFR